MSRTKRSGGKSSRAGAGKPPAPPSVLIAVRRLLRERGRLSPSQVTQGLVALGWGRFDLDAVNKRLQAEPREFLLIQGKWTLRTQATVAARPVRAAAARATVAARVSTPVRRVPPPRIAEPERAYSAVKPAPRSIEFGSQATPGACRACDLVPDVRGRCACS